jgi:hypothetical protein
MPAMPQMMRSSCFGFFAPPAVTIVVLASPMSFVETTSTNFLTASTSKVAANAWTRWRSPPPGQDRKGARTIFLLKAFASSRLSRNCWYWLFGPPWIMMGYKSFAGCAVFCCARAVASISAAAATACQRITNIHSLFCIPLACMHVFGALFCSVKLQLAAVRH